MGFGVKGRISRKMQDAKKLLHILNVEKLDYWQDCEKYYSSLDFKGRNVLDLGSDFGTSPAYFLKHGARFVLGYSLEKQYFKDSGYDHIVGKFVPDHVDYRGWVLKSDCEGYEWDLSPEFMSQFHDWVVALHSPITNEPLYNWIKENGEFVADPMAQYHARNFRNPMPDQWGNPYGIKEFAVYRRKK